MNLSVNPFALLLFASGMATIVMAFIIIGRLKQCERSFAFVIGLAGWWAAGSGAEHFSASPSTMLFWVRFQYLGIGLLPPALFFFISVFISKRKFEFRPYHYLIFAIPVFTIFLVWTDDIHHLYYKTVTVERTGSFGVLKIKPAFWYYVFTAYWYLILTWSIYLLITGLKKADRIGKKQIHNILYAIIIPWIVNIFYKFGLSANNNLDLTPFTFILTSIIITYGLLRYRLLDVIPAARQKILESMQDAILVMDVAGKIVDKNHRLNDVVSNFERDILNTHLSDLFPHQNELLNAVSRKRNITLEIEIISNGIERYYEVDFNVLFDKSSDYSGGILIFHDVSQRKKDALALEALNRFKDRIFSIIAHDLRSPLINIMDMVRLIDEKVITEEEFRTFLPQLSKNLNYTSNLLDNLLHWSRSQLTGELINPEVVDIRDIVQHELLYYQQKAAQKGIKLHDEIKGEMLAIVDTEMIQLVMRNLVGNAIKFCSEGDSIAVSAVVKRANEIEICVRDTGIGMKPETVERLFMIENFTIRGTNNEQGTGLGLQLCKDFVEKNNGKIWVSTEWGKGSAFYFTVPRRVSQHTLAEV